MSASGNSSHSPQDRTFPLGVAARMTGLSADVLRAWERRYGVVTPLRTPGGTRRYRATDLDHLRKVKAAVDAGHRISEVAALDAEELESRSRREVGRGIPLEPIVDAVDRLDGIEADRLLSLQLSSLGPTRFAQELAGPLLEAIGKRWESGRLCVASEHLASSLLRTQLGAALRPPLTSQLGPVVVFATPPTERHELGLLVAAVTAMGAGANPLYLGPDLPPEEVVLAAERSQARAVALSVVTLTAEEGRDAVAAVRANLPNGTELWIGGPHAEVLTRDGGGVKIDSLQTLEQRVGLLHN